MEGSSNSILNRYYEAKRKHIELAKQLSEARSSIPKTLCDQQKEILEKYFLYDEDQDKKVNMVIDIQYKVRSQSRYAYT